MAENRPRLALSLVGTFGKSHSIIVGRQSYEHQFHPSLAENVMGLLHEQCKELEIANYPALIKKKKDNVTKI